MTGAVLTPVSTPPTEWSDIEWGLLLAKIAGNKVVPVIGSDLMSVEIGEEDAVDLKVYENAGISGDEDDAESLKRLARRMRLETYLTFRLVKDWAGMKRSPASPAVPIRDLARDPHFNDFVCAYLDRNGDRASIDVFYSVVHLIHEKIKFVASPDGELPAGSVRIPPALQDLARITDFKLFISTTGDHMLECALENIRQSQDVISPSPAFSWGRPTDLPDQVVSGGKSAVYHIFGKFSPEAHGFVMTEQDTLDFVASLQARDSSLGKLNNVLRERHILLIGGGFRGWLARFFLRGANPKLADAEHILAEGMPFDDENLRMFLQRFSPKSVIVAGGAKFAKDLFDRWETARRNQAEAATERPLPPPPPVMPEDKLVFISYERKDHEFASLLRERLKEKGVEAWFDVEQLDSGDNWDKKIRLNIQRCTLFLPLLSLHTENRREGYFRQEWNAAKVRARGIDEDTRFIMPLTVDPALRRVKVEDMRVPDEFKIANLAYVVKIDPEGDDIIGNIVIPDSYLDDVVAAHRAWL